MSELEDYLPSESKHEAGSESGRRSDSGTEETISANINSSTENAFGGVKSSSIHSSTSISHQPVSERRPDAGYESEICDETQVREKWSQLPSLSIEKIYSFLSRTDQFRMSQVCRRWAEYYGSPSLWKLVRFYLPEHCYPSEIYPEVKFARKYGCMFRHVVIIGKATHTQQNLLLTNASQLKLFLEALASKSKLMSIKFICMGMFFRRLDGESRQSVITSIVNLFRCQRSLTVIHFRHFNITRYEGLKLLNAISEECLDTLRELDLTAFVENVSQTEINNEYIAALPGAFDKLLNIKSIRMDYSHIFEDLMRLPYQDYGNRVPAFLKSTDKKCSLSSLYLNCMYFEGFRGIPQSSWETLVKICPDLSVYLTLELGYDYRDTLEMFIVQSMKIKSLKIIECHNDSFSDIDMNVLFNHLLATGINKFLESINITWSSTSELSPGMNLFLRSCSKLRNFNVFITSYNNNLEGILIWPLEHKPDILESIYIFFFYSSEEERACIQTLYKKYYPLLEERGIKLVLKDFSLARR